MAILRLPFIQAFKDRHGRQRYYFRRGYVRAPLKGEPGGRQFMAAYHKALAAHANPQLAAEARLGEGTFDALALAYYRSPHFLALEPSTQRTNRYRIDAWREKHGGKQVSHLKRRHVVDQMAERMEASGPGAANNLLRTLSMLCAFAIELEWRTDNPCRGIKKFKSANDGFVAWSEIDVTKFEERWPVGSRERLALGLLVYTGQRRGDVVRMGPSDVTGDLIHLVQGKTGADLMIPIHPSLKAILDATPIVGETFLTTLRGTAFKSETFGNWFRDACDAAGLPKRSAHGLRKTAAARLAEAGCTTKQIQAITGHATIREVERYTKSADQQRLARQAMAKLQERAAETAKVSNLSNRQLRSSKIKRLDKVSGPGATHFRV